MDFLSCAKTMGNIIGKNVTKNLSGKYCQKHSGHAKTSATDNAKTDSKRVSKKTADATDELIGNKSAYKITSKPKDVKSSAVVIPKDIEFDQKSIEIQKER